MESGPVLLDGATGTMLQEAEMPSGVCPEAWICENPNVILNLQKKYVEAGSRILYAPTFTANRIKLAEYGLSDRLTELNQKLIALSKEAAGGRAYVAADLTMTGRQLYPVGDLDFEDLVDIYKEQVQAVLPASPDLFVVETMMSLQECRAALLAITETCDLPVMISLTYEENGRTLFGSRPDTAMIVLQSMGAAVVGLNCSTGPEAMEQLVRQMTSVAQIPILAKPNAGLPVLFNGKSVYQMTPEEFADGCERLYQAGASFLGGCCGTTPDHIRALSKRLAGKKVLPNHPDKVRMITSERMNTEISLDGRFQIIGERINPTGKKKLQEELRAGKFDLVRQFARDQEEKGASVLDVNMGTNGIDEKQMMIDAIYEITSVTDLPLCIDTSYVDVMEAALRIYPGRALINSISGEEERMQQLLPIAKKYGAMFILLPVSSAGLPKNAAEKHENLERVLSAAEAVGIPETSAVVDLVVATVGADPKSALSCFETLDYCRGRGLPTVCGLSNISFGLPQRSFINTAFLNIAISKGLSMAIANPNQDLLIYTALASDMLLSKDGATEAYLTRMPQEKIALSSAKKEPATEHNPEDKEERISENPIFSNVVKGEKDAIGASVDAALSSGRTPNEILNEDLIPGINEVGRLYDQKTYFLPQLIAGANAMKAAMEKLSPLLAKEGAEEKETIIIATVEGDIHDIGKNLVSLMLKNHGYRVIDLGKDVPAETIVDTAISEHAAIIGLSALMTTTMMQMKNVISLMKEKNCTAKVFIGGACITESFAEEIGADAYSSDAQDAVRVVERLLA